MKFEKLEIEKFLEQIDEWKLKLHKKLKGLSPAQRKAFWKQAHERARARGFNVVDPEEPGQPAKPAKRPPKRVRRAS